VLSTMQDAPLTIGRILAHGATFHGRSTVATWDGEKAVAVGFAEVGARAAAPLLPDVLWYARWDKRASTDGYGALSRGLWTTHQRVHQFVGNTKETHGGVTVNIDRNAVDAPVALVH